MKMKKNILIVDDDINTFSKYKKWLEDEGGFNLTLINDPEVAEVNFKPQNYDLVLIGFRMSIVDGFDIYQKLLEISKAKDTPKEFRICFLTSSLINFNALRELYSEMAEEEEECYVPKHVPKDIFIKHVYAVMSSTPC